MTTTVGLWIAAIVAFIGALQLLTAFQQWRTANNRAVLDLFQRRYEVYQDCHSVVRQLMRGEKVNEEIWLKTVDALDRARFLFGPDVVALLDKLADAVSDMESHQSALEQGHLQASEKLETNKALHLTKVSIHKFREDAPKVFAPYMQFDQRVHPGIVKKAWRLLGRGWKLK